MSKLKIGTIGFGGWVKSAYLPALQYDGRALVAAVAAQSEKTRQNARRVLGEDTAVYGDYRELLKHPGLDAVMVAVPDELHQEALSAALDSGLPVFYEPPISHLRSQIPVMIDRLLGAKQVSFAHLELCRHPAVSRAANLVRDGGVGLLQNVSITLNAGWGATQNADLCLTDRMSCWYVDVLNQIVDAVPSRVMLLDGCGTPGRMQTTGTGIYDYGGVWGMFKADVGRPGSVSIVIDIAGSQGHIQIDYFTGILHYQGILSAHAPIREDCSPQKPYADYPGVRETVTEFLDAVLSGQAGHGNAEAVAQLNWIGLAAEESKYTGTWAKVRNITGL